MGSADWHGFAACGVKFATVTKFSYHVTLQHFSRVAADQPAVYCISMKGRPAPMVSGLARLPSTRRAGVRIFAITTFTSGILNLKSLEMIENAFILRNKHSKNR
jgi:hypothetical protein